MISDVELRTLPPQAVAVVRADVRFEDLAAFLGGAFDEVATALRLQGVSPAGPPFGRYVPQSDGTFQAEVGFPVEHPATVTGRVEPDELPAGTVARILYRGQYDGVSEAYVAATDWMGAHGYSLAGQPWESYLDEPDVSHPRTEVFLPCTTTGPAS